MGRLLYSFFYVISLLPFWFLYGISNVLYFFVYKIFNYRNLVTLTNLQNAFPEKTEAEINAIAKQYYKNLCDSIVETIKLTSISEKELNKRFTGNWHIMQAAFDSGRVAQGHLSHLFNWEWGIVAANWNVPYSFVGIYSKVSSNAMDFFMKKLRSKSGSVLVEMDEMNAAITEVQSKKSVWGFIADQNPSEPRRGVWVPFFGQETSFFKGAELIARRYNNIVFFVKIQRVKRGYYNIVITERFTNPKTTSDGEITTAYVQFLEESIRQQPDNWVWSHRRWKHKRS